VQLNPTRHDFTNNSNNVEMMANDSSTLGLKKRHWFNNQKPFFNSNFQHQQFGKPTNNQRGNLSRPLSYNGI
jgi:hypothetical protein